MDLGLANKKALITGASQGIGREIALELAREGASVTLVARSAEDLEAVRRSIAEFADVEVRIFAGDLARTEVAARLAAEFADVDILINNAGAIPRGRIDEIDEAAWRAAWDLKVFGYINMTRAFYALMKARGAGVILNILGNSGERVDSGYICGSSGNAALMAFTRALGGTSHRDNIRVLALSPGPVATERLVRLTKKEARDRLGDEGRHAEFYKDCPFGRPAACDEISAAAALLVSERSSYTTGTVVTIDGGLANAGSLI